MLRGKDRSGSGQPDTVVAGDAKPSKSSDSQQRNLEAGPTPTFSHHGRTSSDPVRYAGSATDGRDFIPPDGDVRESRERSHTQASMAAVGHLSVMTKDYVPAPMEKQNNIPGYVPVSPHTGKETQVSFGTSHLAFQEGPQIRDLGQPIRHESSVQLNQSTAMTSTDIPVFAHTPSLSSMAMLTPSPVSANGQNVHQRSMSTTDESPTARQEDFTAWLFNEPGVLQSSMFPMNAQPAIGMTNYVDDFGGQIYSNYFADPALNNGYPNMMQQQQQQQPQQLPLEGTGFPILPPSDALLSHGTRRHLIEIIEKRFNEGEGSAFSSLKDEVLAGNRDAEAHVLSMRSMQLYIGSYWYHFHAQLPILHKPTFSADDINAYLLLAVMAIGASCLDEIHGQNVTAPAARFANFVAWHLRWQVFMDVDFRPPAKLWVFQTLLLLEVYEKMNATRALHERAHIHFPTTLTLMRRGSALVGQAGLDTPTGGTSSTGQASRNTFVRPLTVTPDEWWKVWITAEATRRAAFAAFLLDSTHATMFGHAAVMVVHEIRLPLPCDEALWSATSSAEVGRVESSLHANDIKPTTFLDGLSRILTGRKVRTNSFGRMILMAGVLSLSWHMRQRDLQWSSLGVRQVLGVPDGWRNSLTRAFDFWKRDFDESLAHMRNSPRYWQKLGAGMDDEDMSEASATVMHHLAHIAMGVGIHDCQIFAGASQLLGRTVTPADYERVKKKMLQWAHSAGARDAVFHALQMLKKVLVSDSRECDEAREPLQHTGRRDEAGICQYNARDDFLLNRPWVLFFSALIVWSYGFALDGPLRPFPSYLDPPLNYNNTPTTLPTWDEVELARANFTDAKSFLASVGAVRNSRELEQISGGRNRVVGLLNVVSGAFESSRWELLHEAAERLREAIALLKGDD
jgi:hypothetical protein